MRSKHKKRLVRILVIVFVVTGVLIFALNRTENVKINNNTIQQVKIHNIKLTKSGFEPKTLTVKKNEIVIWTNYTDEAATVNSDKYPTHELFPELNLGTFNGRESVQTSFSSTGSKKYHNYFIPAQTGTINVTE